MFSIRRWPRVADRALLWKFIILKIEPSLPRSFQVRVMIDCSSSTYSSYYPCVRGGNHLDLRNVYMHIVNKIFSKLKL